MNKKKSKHFFIVLFMVAAGAIVCGRLLMLTVISHDKWQDYADAASQRAVYETAPRGDILDRNGEVLAASKPRYHINMSRVNLTKEKALSSANEVMSILSQEGENINKTQEDIKAQLSASGYDAYLPIVLAEGVSPRTVKKIEAKSCSGVYVSTDYVRDYPKGSLASHILGYVGSISKEEKKAAEDKGYRKDSLIGKSGIEKVREEVLRGTDGVSNLQIDSMGNVKKLLSKSNGKKGQDVQLTIDAEVQEVTEDALQRAIDAASVGGTFLSDYGDMQMTYAKNAASGAAVVLNVKTGEVLTLASLPGFDPNDFAEGISQEKWNDLQQENPYDPLSPAPLYNIATMTAVQPGSTFKPVTALAALSCGLDPEERLYDDGFVSLSGREYGCFLWNERKETHGYVNLTEGMKVSCNYYFYGIAAGQDLYTGNSLGYDKRIGNDIIIDYAQRLGLGQPSGVEIGESGGTLPSKEEKIRGIKSSLYNYLMSQQEVYFTKKVLKDRKNFGKKFENIVKWADKDLTLKEIIGKLKRDKIVRPEKLSELAKVCASDYFSQTEWTMGDTFNIAIGQGDNCYTTLQMANYMAAMGNGGKKNAVSLVVDQDREDSSDSGINKKHIDRVIRSMVEVTWADGGSLQGVFRGFPYSTAAKTGTAQRAGKKSVMNEEEYIKRHLHLIASDISFEQAQAEARRLREEYPDIYSDNGNAVRRAVINLSSNDLTSEDLDRYKESYDSFAWTVALAPSDEPEIAVAVMMVQGKTSLNAAPVVREIIGKYGEKYKWEKLF
ncbi:MAG: hypothetical protein GX663_03075 [Clostridiales bacterium]|nr:hypothetical protein [Clostridiales bacterium]